MTLLGIDVGTTHCKAGLFALDGSALRIARRDNRARRAPQGYAYFDPGELWEAVVSAVAELMAWAGEEGLEPPAAVGIASMAESGLLVDRRTGEARTPIYPWFDQSAAPQAERLRDMPAQRERFYRRGLQPTFKCSLAKILWLREAGLADLQGAAWLSAADYVAYRLTGAMATDYSLAVRTYAFDLKNKTWDHEQLDNLGLPGDLFPGLLPSGAPVGGMAAHSHEETGLPLGIPVGVGGHDHICGAFAAGMAAGGIEPGLIFDSLGTAESFLGSFPERALGEREREAGFAYGMHTAPGCMYWLGGLSASGGSVEWLRAALGDPPLSYEQLCALLPDPPGGPTSILYYPYLAGSGSPHTDMQARGAFIGLSAAHSRADLYQAVLEGVAYEIEYMRRTAQGIFGAPIRRIVAAGGGTRNRAWMQIRADVSGCRVEALSQAEATLQGAALLAGLGAGIYADQDDVAASLARQPVGLYLPREQYHRIYQHLYEQGFLVLQEALRAYYRG
ncbi:MAG: hypothetical protein JXA78_04355 [Anaerolineales bacterium]|nr:hypothetical protein [Anaerolineales bacterium]